MPMRCVIIQSRKQFCAIQQMSNSIISQQTQRRCKFLVKDCKMLGERTTPIGFMLLWAHPIVVEPLIHQWRHLYLHVELFNTLLKCKCSYLILHNRVMRFCNITNLILNTILNSLDEKVLLLN